MRSTIASLATVAAGLFASTVSADGKVAIYWGQGAYQKELSVVCNDPSVDIVNIAFVNGFPENSNKYPDTNFGKLSCFRSDTKANRLQETLVDLDTTRTLMAHQASFFRTALPSRPVSQSVTGTARRCCCPLAVVIPQVSFNHTLFVLSIIDGGRLLHC